MPQEPKSLFAIGLRACLLLVVLVGLAGEVTAQSARSGDSSREQQAMAKMQYLMRQLSAEKAELQARNAQLEGEIEALRADLEQLESRLGRTSEALDRYKETDEKLRELLQKSQDRTRDLIDQYNGKLQEAALLIGDLRTEKAEVEGISAQRQQAIETCESKNEELFQVNAELLERYEKKGLWDSFKQREPFTGLGAVAIENAIAEYRFKLEDLRFDRRRWEASR